jgi:hypothetical protein
VIVRATPVAANDSIRRHETARGAFGQLAMVVVVSERSADRHSEFIVLE